MILSLNKFLGLGCDKLFTLQQCGTDLENIVVVLGASVDVQVGFGRKNQEAGFPIACVISCRYPGELNRI